MSCLGTAQHASNATRSSVYVPAFENLKMVCVLLSSEKRVTLDVSLQVCTFALSMSQTSGEPVRLLHSTSVFLPFTAVSLDRGCAAVIRLVELSANTYLTPHGELVALARRFLAWQTRYRRNEATLTPCADQRRSRTFGSYLPIYGTSAIT